MKNLFLILIFPFFFAACEDRVGEDMSSVWTYERAGEEYNKILTGKLYNDNILLIGNEFIFLDGFEEKRYDFGQPTYNYATNQYSTFTTELSEEQSGYFEISSIEDHGQYYLISGAFDFKIWNKSEPTISEDYENGVFNSLYVYADPTNYFKGRIQFTEDGITRKYFANISLVDNSEIIKYSCFHQFGTLYFFVPEFPSLGDFEIQSHNVGPGGTFGFAFSFVDKNGENQYFSQPKNDSLNGWPSFSISEINDSGNTVEGEFSGTFGNSNDTKTITIENGSFTFY
ncbi:MAG: hypothetical protein HKN16_02150 [Saprospiraceae bacterium]|nr:hypothetical protein [Saprospiraceae bacterium]